MNPTALELEGYGRFIERTRIDIPTGTVAVIGPNGAGKSRLLDAIELALFADGSRDLAQWLAPGCSQLELVLWFEHAGEAYRVRRVYLGGTRGKSTVDFERHNIGYQDFTTTNGVTAPALDVRWESLNRETAAATNDFIAHTLGISRTTFGASSFLGQGNTGAFPTATAGERKAMLGEILDPHGEWPRRAKQAKALADLAASDVVKLAAQIGTLELRTAERGTVEQDILRLDSEQTLQQAHLADAEKRTEEAQQAVVDNAAGAERVRSLTEAHTRAQTARVAAQDSLAKAEAIVVKIGPAEVQLATLEQAASEIPALEEKVAEQREWGAKVDAAQELKRTCMAEAVQLTTTAGKLGDEHDTLSQLHQRLVGELMHLEEAEPGTERCRECDQVLGVEDQAKAIASRKAQIATLADEVTAKKIAYEEARLLAAQAMQRATEVVIPTVPEGNFEAQLMEARRAVERVATGRALLEQWRETAETVPALQATLNDAELALSEAVAAVTEISAEAKDSAEFDRALADAKQAVGQRRAELEQTTARLIMARAKLDQLDQAAKEITVVQEQLRKRQGDVDRYRLGEKVFGRDGIPTLIAENAIPQIEAEANRILELMPTAKGETLRVELRTQRDNKSNENVRETLDILVEDGLCTRQFETFSGGERERIGVALRVGLAKLIKDRRGADCPVLVLDEPEHLDALGHDQLVDVLLSVAGEYNRMLVASHAPGIRDAFGSTIEIGSDADGWSFIVGQGAQVVDVTEAVAA